VSEDDADDEDWFETALGEDDQSEGDDAGTDDTDWGGFDEADEPGDGDASTDDTPSGADADGAFEDAFDAGGDADADGPFDGDTPEFGDADADGPFGGSSTDATPFGGGGGGEGLFEDGFASAFESAGGEFDGEEFESDIPRVDLGIEGLDEMIRGGIPQRHLIVTIGAAGTGKTTFGLQYLYHGLRQGDSGVFITLEQSRETIVDTANERGWEFDRYESEDTLAVVDLDPVEMANSLDNIRSELPELVRDFGADRLVLDSVSLLEMMYDDQARRRTEVFDFTRSLKNAGVTTFLTSEASESNPYASRHGIIEYLTDAVFVLQYVRGETQETRLAVEIQKIRNANHSREKKPYDITKEGISVYQQANIF
jgi:KaiC domain protein